MAGQQCVTLTHKRARATLTAYRKLGGSWAEQHVNVGCWAEQHVNVHCVRTTTCSFSPYVCVRVPDRSTHARTLGRIRESCNA